MRGSIIAKYVTPWRYRRDEQARRVAALRARDGDDCRRCRRPLRFDLPSGHDQGARIEQILTVVAADGQALDNFCLTHGRCNPAMVDHTSEVQARVRIKSEAALLSKTRKKTGRAA